VYGATKAMGESLALSHHDDVTILRVASLFGTAGASGKGGNFVETMLKLASDRDTLNVVNDITMSPTSTWDLAHMIFRMLDCEGSAGIYHAVNDGKATWFEFASEIFKLTGNSINVLPCTSDEFPTKAQRPAYSVLDNSKIKSVIGNIEPWQDALARYLSAKGHI